MSRIFMALSLCGFAVSAMAAEPNGFQIRLTTGIAPGISKLSTTDSKNPNGSANKVNNGDDILIAQLGFTLEPGFIYSFPMEKSWGFEVGSNFFYRSVHGAASYAGGAEAGGTDVNVKLTSYGLDLVGGVYWQLNQWRLEMTPVIGYGQGRTNINVSSPLGSSNDTTEYVPYIDYGFRVGAYYSLPQYVLLGLQVGYQEFTTSATQLTLADGSSEKDKVSGAGMLAALSFVLVF